MKIYQVDAFTDEPFKGNPAAVCILSELKDNRWMQNVANEMNLSETAFFYKEEKGYNLRWFTPEHEEDLCGHATLASAFVLWKTQRVSEGKKINFRTRSGLLTAEKNNEWIEINLPLEAEKEVESEELVKNIKPDFQLLENLKSRGVIVTSKSSSKKYDFISRFLAYQASERGGAIKVRLDEKNLT